MSRDTNGTGYDFGRARVVAGLGLTFLVVVLMTIDAISVDYMLDSVQLALLLGTGGTLLGVEVLLRRLSD